MDREEYTNIMDHVKNLWSRYLQWVSENPTLATEMETSIKWISLIATGRHYILITYTIKLTAYRKTPHTTQNDPNDPLEQMGHDTTLLLFIGCHN